MLWLLRVVVLAVLVSGCKDPLTRKLASLADEACACRDRACAQRARAKLDALVEDMTEPPKSNATRIAALLSKASVCIDDALRAPKPRRDH